MILMPASRNSDSRKVYTNAVAHARGLLQPDQRASLESNLRTLRYLEGSGMTTRHKLRIRDDTVYLVVGLGGQGIQKLAAVKHQLEHDCDIEDVKQYVRFLAVDTDCGALQNNTDFNRTEKVEIKAGAAPILANKNSAQFLKWINPELDHHITGQMNGLGWSGDGANQCRQAGRVKLADDQNRKSLEQKARNALLSMNPDGAKKVRIFVIAGLAGGTGSGTVVDVPYILREVVNANGTHGEGSLAIAPDNFIIEGYLLLPPACGNETDPQKSALGNRNAYAALKEIDYFMMLNSMHRSDPGAQYEFCRITSTANIFETCTLVDGMYAGAGAVQDPAQLANEIVAHTIVTSMANVIAKNDKGEDRDPNQSTYFGSTSYISNLPQTSANQLSNNDYQICPREANYRFLSCGYYEVIVPVDLMTVYVANRVFCRVWQEYSKASDVTQMHAELFLERAHLTPKDIVQRIKRNEDLRRDRLPDDAIEHMNHLFKQNGPYYMINLLRAVLDLLSADYINQGRKSLRWDEARGYLRAYKGVLGKLQNQDYAVYTLVIEQLQKILENDADILTNTTRHKQAFRETFYWEPIDLTKADEGQQAVKKYLVELLSDTEIEDFADQFTTDLVAHRNEWVDLFESSQFDAAKQIRTFIEEKIGSRIDATIEDFLVKLFTKNYQATATEGGLGNSSPVQIDNALNEAAEQIFQRFETRSSPLAAMDPTDIRVFRGGLKNYILPSSAQRIGEKLKENHGIDSANLYYGAANDRLICITMYAGVPAFFYRWTRKGEEAYEQSVHAIGLHIEQPDDKPEDSWANLPNLIPESKKTYSNREAELYSSVKKLLDEAIKYKLVLVNPDSQCIPYTIRLIEEGDGEQTEQLIQQYIDKAKYTFTIGDVVANPVSGIAPHELINDLLVDLKVLTENTKLQIGTNDLSPGVELSSEKMEEYKYSMAIKQLRKSLFLQKRLQATIETMRHFENYVKKSNEQVAHSLRMEQRRDIFRKLLLSDAIFCRESVWFYEVINQQKKLVTKTLVSYVSEKQVAKTFNLYLAYLHFVALDDKAFEAIQATYEKAIPDDRKSESYVEKRREAYYRDIIELTEEENYADVIEKDKWLDPSGKLVSAAEIITFYSGMANDLKPVYSGWDCPICGTKSIRSKYCPECGAQKPESSLGWICPSCGTKDIASKYCPNCGEKKPETTVDWICSQCGTKSITSQFCPNCGFKRP